MCKYWEPNDYNVFKSFYHSIQLSSDHISDHNINRLNILTIYIYICQRNNLIIFDNDLEERVTKHLCQMYVRVYFFSKNLEIFGYFIIYFLTYFFIFLNVSVIKCLNVFFVHCYKVYKKRYSFSFRTQVSLP